MASGEKGGGEMSDNRHINLNSDVPALQYPDSTSVTVQLNQPRQPTNLQDLLRYSFEASGGQLQTSNSTFLPLDEEVHLHDFCWTTSRNRFIYWMLRPSLFCLKKKNQL